MIAVIAVLIVLCLILALQAFRKPSQLSPDILKITRPVKTLTGVVTEVRDSTFLVKQDKSAPSESDLPPEAKIVYTVHVTPQTRMQSQLTEDYFLPGSIPALPPVLEKDRIEVGMPVSIQVKEDLRTLQTRDITALVVILPATRTFGVGTVSALGQNTISLKSGNAVPPLSYPMGVNTDYYDMSGSEAKKITAKDLKLNSKVVIFTKFNITRSHDNTVLRVVVLPREDVPSPSPIFTKVIVP